MFTRNLGDLMGETWADLGTPEQTTFSEQTRAALLLRNDSPPDLLVAVRIADQEELWARRLGRLGWKRFGAPAGSGTISDLCACAVGPEDYVFVVKYDRVSDSNRLWLGRNARGRFEGSDYATAQWTDLGNRPGQGLELARTGGCTNIAGETVYAFVKTISNDPAAAHIWVVWGKGDAFQWTDLGAPNGRIVMLCYGAIMIGGRSPAVTIRTSDEHIWMNSWDNSSRSWCWTDLGKPWPADGAARSAIQGHVETRSAT